MVASNIRTQQTPVRFIAPPLADARKPRQRGAEHSRGHPGSKAALRPRCPPFHRVASGRIHREAVEERVAVHLTGKAIEEVGERIDQSPPPVHRGNGRSMRAQNDAQHGRPGGAWGEDRTRTEGKGRGARQESEGLIVPMKRGNARGGKEPWFSVLREE